MGRMPFEKELEVARALAAQAGEVALRYRRDGVRTEIKLDLSPVTAADRECERLISRALDEAFPDDGLLGEEGAQKEARSGRRWILDPIDGTVDFVRGIPNWSVLIALEDRDGVAVGVCHLAEQGEMYYAARNGGAWANERRVRVSGISDPRQALLCVNGLNTMLEMPFASGLLEWMSGFWAVRSFSGCQDAMMVASGRADAWVEPYAKEWDLAPLKIILEEAGGVFFNFDGGSSIRGGNCCVSTPALAPHLRRLVLGAGSRQ